MHLLSRKDLNSAELDIVRVSRDPTTVITANGDVQTNEEATVYVYDLDLFVTVQIFGDTPAVLSLGQFCEDHGYSITHSVNTILPIQQNPMKNGYDENKGYDESYENKCATNYSIITNNKWNDTHNMQLTMHNKYTNDDVHTDDCVVHIMR